MREKTGMKKEEVQKSVGKLVKDINHWTGELVAARGKRDEDSISYAHWAMESLLVASKQELTFLAEYIGEMKDDFDLEEAYKNVDEVQFQRGYKKGKREILTELDIMIRNTSFGDVEGEILKWIEEKEVE